MQKQTILEYRLIRNEIDTLKKCTTDYLGFIFVMNGIVFSAWGAINAITDVRNYEPIAHSALALSLVALSVLLILIYKFVSHNRLAGYCMLLNQELWTNDNGRIDDLLAWEWCIELLREADVKTKLKMMIFEGLSDEEKNMAIDYNIKSPPRKRCTWKGIILLAKSLLRLQKTSSWGFPISIIRIFFILIWGLIGFAFYLFNKACPLNVISNLYHFNWLIFGAVILIQIILWANVCNRFYTIMKGQATVRSFCRRFAPIRKLVLKEYGIEGKWALIERFDKEDLNT